MTRFGEFDSTSKMERAPSAKDLEALVLAHVAEIAALKAENEKLAQRVVTLEEALRLERAARYAPRSEKIRDRIFNEAEQAAAEEDAPDCSATIWMRRATIRMRTDCRGASRMACVIVAGKIYVAA